MRMYPGQEKKIREYYQKNPTELARASWPSFEEKVMDLIQKKAKVNIESVSKDDLQKLLNFSDQKTSSTKTKTSLKIAKKVEKK